MTAKCEKLYDRYLTGVKGIFEKGIERGLFVELDPFYVALCFHGVMQAFVTYWLRKAPDEPLETRVEKLHYMFVGRIRTNGASQQPSARDNGDLPCSDTQHS